MNTITFGDDPRWSDIPSILARYIVTYGKDEVKPEKITKEQTQKHGGYVWRVKRCMA